MNKVHILYFIILISLFGCNQQKSIRIVGEAQGTYYMISYYGAEMPDLQNEIDSLLTLFDESVSLWVENSIISKVNANDPSVLIDRYFSDIFMLSQQVAMETDGAFDFTVGPLIKAWGFGKNGALDIDSTHIDSLLSYTGPGKVTLFKNQVIKKDDRVQIDFNGIAQGYSVDMIAGFLKDKGIDNFIVDIGGEVRANGQKPDGSSWKVGIEKPAADAEAERELTIVIELNNKSVATSGNYRKYIEKDGKRYSHIIDPETGYPAMHNLLSVTIIYDNAALADAYATACMVMGLEKALKFVDSRQNMEAFFIFTNEKGEYQTKATDGFSL